MKVYKIGERGPAGGFVFYDKKEYSDGWRYLEAAPADLRLVDHVPTVDKTVSGYSCGTDSFFWGFFRTSDDGNNLFTNGTETFIAADCTGTTIGTGKRNTHILVGAMGKKSYSSSNGPSKTRYYAARLCDILTYTVDGITYDDWFLPSRDELNELCTNLRGKDWDSLADSSFNYFGTVIYNPSWYWSSSEYSDRANSAWSQSFIKEGNEYRSYYSYYLRSNLLRVLPVRAF